MSTYRFILAIAALLAGGAVLRRATLREDGLDPRVFIGMALLSFGVGVLS